MYTMASSSLSSCVCLWSPCTIPNWMQSLDFKCNVPKGSVLWQYTTVSLFKYTVLLTVILCSYCVLYVSGVLTL